MSVPITFGPVFFSFGQFTVKVDTLDGARIKRFASDHPLDGNPIESGGRVIGNGAMPPAWKSEVP